MAPVWPALRRGLFLPAALAITGCTDAMTVPPTPEPWESTMLVDHPLTGRIWNTTTHRFVSPAAVVAALADADFVLLGEKHDNPDHHRLQARMIRALAERGRRPAIILEMLDPEQERALADYLKTHPGDAAGIGPAIGWTERGWPDWAIYQPIAAAALDTGIPMLAGTLAGDTVRQVGTESFAALGADRVKHLGLDEPVPESMRAEMRAEISESHCDYLPDAALGPMVDVQLVKDAVMADALQRGEAIDGRNTAILIAGAGHVRGDRGVPWHLRRMAPSRVSVTVGFIETQPGETDAEAYEQGSDGLRAFDFLWFTPRVDNEDPCAVFAEQLRRMRERRTSAEPATDN